MPKLPLGALLVALLGLGCKPSAQQGAVAVEAPTPVAGALPTTAGTSEGTAADIPGEAGPWGTPSVQSEDALPYVKAMRDGGGEGRLAAGEGEKLLVVTFPETEGSTQGVTFLSPEVDLTLEGGGTLGVFAVMTDIANLPSGREGRVPHFQDEIYMTTFTPSAGFPFAVVFKVPATSVRGTLRLKGSKTPLAW